jgi:hypothetical protein
MEKVVAHQVGKNCQTGTILKVLTQNLVTTAACQSRPFSASGAGTIAQLLNSSCFQFLPLRFFVPFVPARLLDFPIWAGRSRRPTSALQGQMRDLVSPRFFFCMRRSSDFSHCQGRWLGLVILSDHQSPKHHPAPNHRSRTKTRSPTASISSPRHQTVGPSLAGAGIVKFCSDGLGCFLACPPPSFEAR